MAQPVAPPSATSITRAIVKQVLSGDSVVIRGQPKGGPPPERTIGLTHVQAPKLARRPNPNDPNSEETKDEPYAWEAREYLREKIIGKEITFLLDYKVSSGREFGWVYLGRETDGENLNVALISEGLVEARKSSIKATDEQGQNLLVLEDAAKAAGKGKWANDNLNLHVRDVKWTLDNARKFVDSLHEKPVKAIIEHVRDGSTVRAFLIPSFQYVTVMLSGIRCPVNKLSGETEPYADEAKFFVETRLLNRDVEIVLEGVAGGGGGPNQNAESNFPSTAPTNLLGTVLHPNGNISELLLREGLARCVEWSLAVCTQKPEDLLKAEKLAKENRRRIWKDYKAPSADSKAVTFQAKVVEIVNGESLVVQKVEDNSVKKIFLASIRSPRLDSVRGRDSKEGADVVKRTTTGKRSQDINDIPFFFEAREFLRKKLIGKKVSIRVEYVQPPNQGFPEKTCASIDVSGVNVSEALVSKGYATVVRYRQDDDQRAANYDDLLTAEMKAKKSGKGMFSKPETWPTHRIADVTGDANKAKQFLPFLQRAGRSEGVVEFVASGSRLRLYLPKETCLITFLLAGISCPKGARPAPGGGSSMVGAEPGGEEALTFTKDLCLQHEVLIEVENIDRAGNFIGWLFVDGQNLSVSLVAQGLASVHSTAERSKYFSTLTTSESTAKLGKLNLWKNYVESTEPEDVENDVDTGPVERQTNYKQAMVSYVTEELNFYLQYVDDGKRLEELMDNIYQHFEDTPPVLGAYTPKKGDLCAAKYVDNSWYRAKVEKVTKSGGNIIILVLFVDYGNRETIRDPTLLTSLPSQFQGMSSFAHLHSLALVKLPPESDDVTACIEAFQEEVEEKEVSVNVEQRSGGVPQATLLVEEKDVGKTLIEKGFATVESRRERRLQTLLQDYQKAQDSAKDKRLNLWRYGDFRGEEAREFGMGV